MIDKKLMLVTALAFSNVGCYATSHFFSAAPSLSGSAKQSFTRTSIILNHDALESRTISLTTPQGRNIIFEKLDRQLEKSQSWRGKEDWREDLVISREGKNLVGVMHTSTANYLIISDGITSTLTETLLVNESQEHATEYSTGATGIVSQDTISTDTPRSAIASISAPDIRVAFVYTPLAAAFFQGNIIAASQNAIASLNTELQNSNVRMTATSAGALLINTEYSDDTNAIRGAKASTAVINFRNQNTADIIVIASPLPGTSCGLADSIFSNPNTAFVVVAPRCFSNRSVSHEIGHLFGARHDRTQDATDFPIANAHGLWHQENNGPCWHTIMSYPVESSIYATCPQGDPRIPYFSNPSITYQGWSTGTPGENVAAALNDNAAYISGFRKTELKPNPTGTLADTIRAINLIISRLLKRGNKT